MAERNWPGLGIAPRSSLRNGVIHSQDRPVKRKRRSRLIVWGLFVVVITLRLLFPPPPREPEFAGGGGDFQGGGQRFRRPPTRVEPARAEVPKDFWRIEIDIKEEDVDTLRGYSWRGWGGQSQVQARPEVLATVREGGTVYTNVALHQKGSAGSFRPIDDKPALTLNFSKQAKGQSFHGLSKLSLNNSVQDPSYLSEQICRELFLAAGVPVPTTTHATVILNGRDLGLYVLAEGWGKPFLRKHFKETGGNLYDGGFLKDIDGPLDTNSGDKPDDRSDLDRLLEAANESDQTKRLERLSQVLDLDRFYSFVALEIMTCHWDGYSLNRNNYRVFDDRATGRMVFMPHGLDQMFGVFQSSPDSTIQPGFRGLMAQAVIATPEGSKMLLERIGTLRTNLFREDRLTNRVQELAARLRPTLAAYSPELAREHEYHTAELCRRITERAISISEQLAAPSETLTFGPDGSVALDDWEFRPSGRGRGAVESSQEERDGRPVLLIVAGRGGGAGAWRRRVMLGPGQYRLEAEVRTQGVGGSGGVLLGQPSFRRGDWRSSDDRWTRLTHHFSVDQMRVELELVCAFRAGAGEAWFDTQSLRLVRE